MTPPRPKSLVREYVESIVVAVILALAIRTVVVQAFKIPTGSMRPTLMEGDRILVTKILYRVKSPQRGDIVVFRSPENPKRPFIKRLIGLGGDHIEIRDGRIILNGQLTTLPVISQNYYYNQGAYGQEKQVIDVPPNSYFVLGDNSASSQDSRFWGFVPKRFMIGKALYIFWPPWRMRQLK